MSADKLSRPGLGTRAMQLQAGITRAKGVPRPSNVRNDNNRKIKISSSHLTSTEWSKSRKFSDIPEALVQAQNQAQEKLIGAINVLDDFWNI